MSLSNEQIVKNATTYFKLCEKYGVLTESAVNEMGDAIIKSPASLKFGAYEGGLIEFILGFAIKAIKMNESLGESGANKDSLAKIALLYQCSKYKLFQETKLDWKKQKGEIFEYVKGMPNINTGPRSAKFAIEHGIQLSDEEYSALLSLDEPESNHDNTICVLIRTAVRLTMKNYGKY